LGYFYRAYAREDLQGHQGSIADFNKAIEINPQYSLAYRNRAIAKGLVDNLQGACVYWRTASSLGDTDAARLV